MKDFFEIVTLSDCLGCRKTKTNLKDGNNMSPVEVILGGAAIIKSILGLFGGGSRRLTQDDWNKLFPSNGYWTTRLRNYLSSQIGWDTDLNKILAGSGLTYLEGNTQVFVHKNLNELSGGKWANLQTTLTAVQFQTELNNFYKILEAESKGQSGSSQAGILGDLGIVPLLIIGGIVLSVMSSPTKKRRTSR